MGGRGWSWLAVDGRGWSHDLVIPMQQKLFQNFLPQEAGGFENSKQKKPQKLRPKLRKICILYIYRGYLLCLPSNASGSLL